MGLLVDGVWHDQWYDTAATGGQFERPPTAFRNWISAGSDFPPAPGRYHLYVSWACPWAHRTLIYRTLKGLEGAIGVSVVEPRCWSRAGSLPKAPIRSMAPVICGRSTPRPTGITGGRASVPVLWDRVRGTIVNNESADIIRMLDAWPGAKGPLFRPPELAGEIDALNDAIYPAINNGVYRAGFATAQGAYEKAFDEVFAMLDLLEQRLQTRCFLLESGSARRIGGC